MVRKHSSCYNFEDGEDTVNSFLNNVRSKFKPSTEVLIKCGFSIENLQSVPVDSGEPIVSINYWTTGPHKTTYFNDDLFFGLIYNILKRVIVTGQSCRSQ